MPAIGFALLLAACETSAPAAPGPSPSDRGTVSPSPPSSPPARVAVAFIQDLSPEGSFERTVPVLQAVELAFDTASATDEESLVVEVDAFDTEGVEATAAEVAREIAGDPRFVAAIAAPWLPNQATLVEALGGVPLLSLSARGRVDAAAPGTWLRLVPPLDVQARALAEAAASIRGGRKGICFVATPPDGTTYARTVRRALDEDLDVVDVARATEAIDAGCGIALWPGGAVAGAELTIALEGSSGSAPILLGGPALREPPFLAVAGESARGAVSLCPCVDVSTSLDLPAQRFIQDLQSEHGRPPGPFAVEGWDAAHILIDALREIGPTRENVTTGLAETAAVDGLGGTYTFDGVELRDPESALRWYRVVGGRWLEIDPAGG